MPLEVGRKTSTIRNIFVCSNIEEAYRMPQMEDAIKNEKEERKRKRKREREKRNLLSAEVKYSPMRPDILS